MKILDNNISFIGGIVDEVERKVILMIFVLIFVFGFIGNFFVFLVVVKKYIWIINDIFIVYLVIFDLFFIFLCLLVFIYM